jgi:hypothetical protein
LQNNTERIETVAKDPHVEKLKQAKEMQHLMGELENPGYGDLILI